MMFYVPRICIILIQVLIELLIKYVIHFHVYRAKYIIYIIFILDTIYKSCNQSLYYTFKLSICT